MKALADYVHGKGLKFGIYSDAGTGTCQNRPGGRGYEFQDARPVCRLGRRLSEVRLVQSQHAKFRGVLLDHARCAEEIRAANRVQPLRMGIHEAMAMGERRRQSVAHHGRHRRQMGWHRKNGAASASSRFSTCRMVCNRTPGRATGTIRTCWRSAMAA